MKKIFSRLGPVDSSSSNSPPLPPTSSCSPPPLTAPASASASNPGSASIGSTWTVGRRVVVCEDIIAEGGFGVVFAVKPKDKSKGTLALKRMFVNNEKDLAVCKREINIVSNLNGHPNLIGYVDSTISLLDGGVHEVLLLMPYHKATLLQMMNQSINTGRFTESQVLDIFCDVCSAVSRLHHCQTPIIHRDLKVENVLRNGETGSYILCDFGSATAKVLNPKLQGIGPVEEEIKRYTTLSYRSPEMVDLYSEKPLTSKLDIWALGVFLYKVCFFSLPFGESSLAIQTGKFNFPSTSKFSENMHLLIRYLLTVESDDRPDIFQVCHLAFAMAGRSMDGIQNLHNVPLPSFEKLKTLVETPSEAAKEEPKTHSTIPVPAAATAAPPGAALLSPSHNTSVAPRQRPRGSKTAPSAAVIPPPITLKAKPTPAVTSNNASSSSGSSSFNPFHVIPSETQNPFRSKEKEESQAPTSASNPFLPTSSNVNAASTETSSWNPFEDRKMFSQLSEEALFGEQFDQIRKQTNVANPVPNSANASHGKKDPFTSAPFVTRNNC